MKKKTNEEFIEELNKKRPDIIALEPYTYALNNIKFKCKKCGFKWEATPSSVLSHRNCPNFRCHDDYINPNFVDLTGNTYDNLTVIERVDDYISPSGNKSATWKCLCKCGNTTYRTTSWLKMSKNQSCGCLKSELIAKRCTENLIGQKFGRLTVIEYAGSHYDGAMWKCHCDCGKTTIVHARFLKRGGVKSCGCLQSIGEEKIQKFLNKYNIEYVTQKRFDDLVGFGNCKLRYDFYIPDYNILIEYNGRQHYVPVDFKGEGNDKAIENLKKQQIYDKMKADYAFNQNIKLLVIPYWEENNIENILINQLLQKEVG